jgi:hypothetical protein
MAHDYSLPISTPQLRNEGAYHRAPCPFLFLIFCLHGENRRFPAVAKLKCNQVFFPLGVKSPAISRPGATLWGCEIAFLAEVVKQL